MEAVNIRYKKLQADGVFRKNSAKTVQERAGICKKPCFTKLPITKVSQLNFLK